jgi:hypothetical protein
MMFCMLGLVASDIKMCKILRAIDVGTQELSQTMERGPRRGVSKAEHTGCAQVVEFGPEHSFAPSKSSIFVMIYSMEVCVGLHHPRPVCLRQFRAEIDLWYWWKQSTPLDCPLLRSFK